MEDPSVTRMRPEGTNRPALNQPPQPVKPGIVQKPDRAKQVRALAELIRRVPGVDGLPPALEVESLRPHVNVFAVAGQDVRQRDRHVQAADLGLEVFPGFGIEFIEHVLGEFPAGFGIEPEHPQAAVQEHRPARHTIEDAVLDQHAAMHRPNRLELLEGHHPVIRWPGPEAPDQFPIRGAQAVNPAIVGTEQNQALVVGRRRIDPAPSGPGPEHGSGFHIQRVH